MPGIHLPGTPPRRAAVSSRDSDISLLKRSMAQLRVDIITLLAQGPLMKWELRQALHEPEVAVLKALKELQAQRRVKVVGKVLDKRAWALVSWTAPAKVPHAGTGTTKPKHEAPKESWWTKHAAPDADRKGFVNDADARHRVMSSTSREWKTLTRPSMPNE